MPMAPQLPVISEAGSRHTLPATREYRHDQNSDTGNYGHDANQQDMRPIAARPDIEPKLKNQRDQGKWRPSRPRVIRCRACLRSATPSRGLKVLSACGRRLASNAPHHTVQGRGRVKPEGPA
jgi:hypothetical protein